MSGVRLWLVAGVKDGQGGYEHGRDASNRVYPFYLLNPFLPSIKSSLSQRLQSDDWPYSPQSN